jgi:hypothetical protein
MLAIPMCWCAGNANFGDWIGPYLVEQITGRPVVRTGSSPGVLITAGSILNWATAGAVVWGSGLVNLTDEVDPRAEIHAVRGPLTREIALKCGAECPEVYGDPALLLPRFIPKPETVYDFGLVPHYTEFPVISYVMEEVPGVQVIDVLRPVQQVVEDIAACESILSSSLHGLIVADAYGIPSRWVQFSNAVLGDGTKFNDHFLATGRLFCEPLVVHWGDRPPRATETADPDKIEQLREGLWNSKPF